MFYQIGIIILFFVCILPVANASSVPEWVKNTAGWWSEDLISETEFVNAIEFLVNTGIIVTTDDEYEPQKPAHDIEDFFKQKVKFLKNDELQPTINSEGFRGSEFDVNKPDNIYRVIAVGGSTTYGAGVEEENSWPAILEKNLNLSNTEKEIEIINAGISAATTLHHLKLIEGKLMNYKPDLLIVYAGGNDTACMLPEFHNANVNWNKENILNSCGDFERSNYTILLAERFSKICDIGERNNFDVVIILQPIIEITGKKLTDDELKQYFERSNHRVMLEDYEKMISTVLRLTENCDRVVDLSNVFFDYDIPIFFDYIHVGETGNKIIAENIQKLISPLIVEKNIFFENPAETQIIEKFQFELNDVQNNRDFKGQNLENEEFFAVNLSGSDFSNTILDNADFRLANLQNVNFKDSSIENVLLHQNILDGADFTNVEFTNVELENVDLSYTNLQNTVFVNKNLERTFFYKSNLSGASLKNCDLNNVLFHGADLTNVDLKNSSFVNVDFSQIKNKSLMGVKINTTSFAYSDFTGVKFSSDKIFVGNFQNVKMSDIDLSEREITGSVFYQANLRGADFSNSDLSGVSKIDTFSPPPGRMWSQELFNQASQEEIEKMVYDLPIVRLIDYYLVDGVPHVEIILYNNFSLADMRNVNMQNAEIFYADFTGADLTGADLTGANLVEVFFKSTNLTDADLRNTVLTNAYLVGANLTGADLTGADLTGADLTGADLTGAVMACSGHEKCQ